MSQKKGIIPWGSQAFYVQLLSFIVNNVTKKNTILALIVNIDFHRKEFFSDFNFTCQKK